MAVPRASRLPFPCFLLHLILLTHLISTALAQEYLLLPTAASSTFPACALSCKVLQQAQDGCVPPRAQQSNDKTYVSCFCESAFLTALHSTPDDTCNTECPKASDRTLLMKWYQNYCATGGKVVVVSTTTPATTSHAAASSAASSKAPSPSTRVGSKAASAGHSWFSTHYRWVIMVIILVLGFGIITIVGIWLKRRYDAKNPGLYHGAGTAPANANTSSRLSKAVSTSVRSSAAAQPAMWGPHQAMAHPRELDFAHPNSYINSRLESTGAEPVDHGVLKSPEVTDDEIREVS